MKYITSLILTCALLVPVCAKADSFEGTVKMSLSTSSDKSHGPQAISYSIKGNLMRIDTQINAAAMGSVIFDLGTRTMTILMPQQSMYMVKQLPAADQAPATTGTGAAPTLQQTSSHETILGYDCVKYVATTKDGTSEIWVTDQLGTFLGLSPGGAPGRRPQAAQGWEQALKGKNFFPMRVVTTPANGKASFSLEVTAVDRGHLSDSLFTPPDGWHKLDLGNFMQGFPGFQRPSS